MKAQMVGTAVIAVFAAAVCGAPARAHAEDLAEKIQRMEQELQEMKGELQRQKAVQQKAEQEKAEQDKAAAERAAAQAAAAPPSKAVAAELLERVKLGGYGSFRFEHSSLDDVKNTFTYRRFVLTTDANIAPRLRSYFELEFERFRKLELEKSQQVSGGGLTTAHAVEGTDDSEISIEQAWMQYDLADWLRFRGGAVLVPLGRFNINHDDNRWDLPRRSLVDRGVPVLPSTAAWDELGVGFTGDVPLSDTVLGNYQLYVMNGVTLDSSIDKVVQQRPGDTALSEDEVELSPSTGTFNLDNKDAKAVSGRFAVSPALGNEIAGSFYWGRYTPDFLPSEDLYALSADGIYGLGPFELEGEYVFTHFGGVKNVARGFANVALQQEASVESPTLEHEVDFELANLASDKQGYWIDLRYRFWPSVLNQTVFGHPFQHPQMIATIRGEQVWLGGLVRRADFGGSGVGSAGQLTGFETENRHIDRVTVGFAYRPVPLVVFQLAYEYTRTDGGKSLADVTNFLPSGVTENEAHSLLTGIAFGF